MTIEFFVLSLAFSFVAFVMAEAINNDTNIFIKIFLFITAVVIVFEMIQLI